MARLTALSIALILAVSSLALAQGVTFDAIRFSAEMAEMQTRLRLTDAQMGKIRPIMQESAEQRLAVLRERGLAGPEDVEQLSVFRNMSLARDMKKVREGTERRLSRVLTHAQMDDFKGMQEALQREHRAAPSRRESS